MDHHCSWIGQCVGLKNRKYFILVFWWGFWSTFFGSSFYIGYYFDDIAKIIRDFSDGNYV